METAHRIADGFRGQRAVVLPRPVVKNGAKQPIVRDLLPTDVGHYPHASWHYVERPAGAEQMILIWCVKGSGWVRMGGKRWKLSRGDVAVLRPGIPHAYGAAAASPWTIYWMHVGGKRAGSFMRLLGGGDGVFNIGESIGSAALFEELIALLGKGYGPAELVLASTMAAHLLAEFASRRRRAAQAVDTHQRLDETIDYMRKHLADRVTIPALAAMANLSASHYAARFREHTGYPVLDYFLRLKAQRAAQLLDGSLLPIQAIARELGYEDPLYFSRVFRRIHGQSPTAYRRVRKG